MPDGVGPRPVAVRVTPDRLARPAHEVLMRLHALTVAAFLCVGSSLALAQGIQTATVTGQVTSSDGLAVPGTTITVQSPALQGVRSTVSDATGGYIFRALPPGAYTITFSLSGMKTVEKKVTVELGRTVPVDATLSLETRQEILTVTGEAPSVIQQSTTGANYRADMI